MNKIQIPWEDRPSDVRTLCGVIHKIRLSDVIIFPHLTVFSTVRSYLFKEGFAGVFRCDNKAVQMNIFSRVQ